MQVPEDREGRLTYPEARWLIYSVAAPTEAAAHAAAQKEMKQRKLRPMLRSSKQRG